MKTTCLFFALLAVCAFSAPAFAQDALSLDRVELEAQVVPDQPPPTAWTLYGIKQKINIVGHGPGQPRTNNSVTVKSNLGGFSPLLLVVGVTPVWEYQPTLDMHFFVLPWLAVIPLMPDPMDPMVTLEFMLPASVSMGEHLCFQAFGQNLANEWTLYSKGLMFTVQ